MSAVSTQISAEIAVKRTANTSKRLSRIMRGTPQIRHPFALYVASPGRNRPQIILQINETSTDLRAQIHRPQNAPTSNRLSAGAAAADNTLESSFRVPPDEHSPNHSNLCDISLTDGHYFSRASKSVFKGWLSQGNSSIDFFAEL